MPFRYITTTLILFMILALASGFDIQHYRELAPFQVLHALADDGAGDGGAADGGADAGTGGVSDGGTDAGGTGEATDGGVDAGTPDSGVTDGGVDAGTPDGVTDGGVDAGTPDGVTDGGVDAGTPDADTSITDGGVDAGTPDTGTGGDTGGGGDDSGGGDTPTPLVPTCILSANPASVSSGGASTLSWSTANATALTIDNAIGAVTPAAAGSTSVSPTVTTTYTGTVTGSGGTDTCSTTVTVPPVSPTVPTCTLSANPASVSSGGASTLSWSTANATALTIDNAIGAVTPVAAGSTSVSPTVTTTYTGTVTGSGGTDTCSTTVTVPPVSPTAPACTLSASPTSVDSGNTSTLSWTTTNGSTFSIDNTIGSVIPVAGGSATTPAITANTTFIGTVTNAAGTSDTCSVGVSVNTGGGTNGGGGGGGGGSRSPNVTLAALPHIGAQPLAYLYLSQIPYTGLDLGPLGTVLYWIALIAWALALAYLVLFGAVPLVSRSARNFGSHVSEALNVREPQVAPHMVSEPVPPPATQEPREAPRGYSSYEGFKSFAHNGALSIDDIVKGLARVPAVASAKAGSHPAPVNVEPIYENVEPIQQLPTLPAGGSTARDLTMALVAGDRLAVFTALRENTRMGTSPEQTLSSAVCLIDDVYRSRIDGTECDPGIARITARLDTTTLERLVSALSTAIDASYSAGITGAKLALTRALAILGA